MENFNQHLLAFFGINLWSILLVNCSRFLLPESDIVTWSSTHRNSPYLIMIPLCISIVSISIFLHSPYFLYLLFYFSALTIITTTDLYTMLVPTMVSIGAIPIGILCAYTKHSIISWEESIIAAIIGYMSLYVIGYIFEKQTGQSGIGDGDFDVMALIGSFTGLYGIWASLMVGSLVGSCIGGVLWFLKKDTSLIRIPFVPLLHIGSVAHLAYALL